VRKAWKAIEPIASPVIGVVTLMLAVFGLPLALVVAVLLRRRFLCSSRPGKLGLEEVFNGLIKLSWICGLAMVLLLAVLGLLLDR